ncbi:MAG: HAD hydrolase-like protein [Moorea sp. SIOASIH]|uniref:HAD family hydrolase n=1 Tax=Moorena sp. SIOASIH TaxID=2607817 RepID=UPI0013BE878C|nr:HAD family hydrolase [Moorena sp. SIOASIH]NEO41884.1 HAD hydrolase-like protein [Moorena sp. SIOASIH]NEO90568.1 HAD hydrolase-like protein [Moorena sp. SIO3G5]
MVPTILALDFDGVLCNGLLEYFQTAWRTYCQIWKPASQTPPENLASSFYRLRPVIEIGWEMPILIHALILGISEDEILQDWSTVAQSIVNSETLDRTDIAKQLDTIRDKWITTDLDGWLSLHQFYPGVIERLDQILSTNTTQLYIVSTKEGRFIKQLLQQQGINLPQERIIGKESKRPKHQTLRQLIEAFPGEAVTLWFVEDRLNSLKSVQQQPDLKPVKLYLADWGYNTKAEQESACNDPRIQLLSLEQFSQDFSNWLD